MPNWKKVITSGSDATLNSLTVTSGVTGSLYGTSSYAITASYISPTFISASAAASGFGSGAGSSVSASYALTASYVNTLNQNVLITGSMAVGTSSLGPFENTLTLGARDTGSEGGQLGLNAPGGTYTSASFIDVWQNQVRILRGTNAGSDAIVTQWNLHTKQMQLPAYTNASSFAGTATANLAVDSSGNIITVSTSGGTVFPYTGDAVITGSLTTTGIIYAQPNGGKYFQGGDDAALYDINAANTMGIYGQQYVTEGAIKLGSEGAVLYGSGSKLGIGTTNPTNGTLEVNGNVYATSFTGSLFGTASYAITASYISPTFISASAAASGFGSGTGSSISASYAATASYVLNSISASFAATASSVNTLNQNVIVNGAVTSSYILVSGSGGNVNRLLVVGSGSNTPLFTVQGSQGELFSITDSLSGSLFSVNDISGLPVLEAFSDGIINFGNPTVPALLTTVKVTSVAGNNTIYSIPTASYDGVWFDYTIKSGSNARAGQIMAIWNGTSVSFTETTTTDIGSTSGVNFTSILSGANLLITGSTSTANWTIKGIVRSI